MPRGEVTGRPPQDFRQHSRRARDGESRCNGWVAIVRENPSPLKSKRGDSGAGLGRSIKAHKSLACRPSAPSRRSLASSGPRARAARPALRVATARRHASSRRAVAHYRQLGIRIVLTDNGSAYQSFAFAHACARARAGHRRTRPYTPRTNGKAARFIQSMLRECAYAC